MIRYWRLAATLMLCLAAAGCVHSGPGVGTLRSAGAGRFDISREDRFLWSCYMICFPVNRDYTGLSYDRPLDRPETANADPRLIDLKNAVDAGCDALSVDLFILDKNAIPAFERLSALIAEHGLSLGLSPMFDGFGRPELSEDDVVAKVSRWFERVADADCVVRTGGKPVIFTYGAGSLSADAWDRILKRLREAGCEGYWIFEGGAPLCLGEQPDFDAVAPWLSRFDSAYTFMPGTVPERPLLNARLYAEHYGDAGKFWVGSTRIGYWRPEIAVYTSPEGTERYRRAWAAVAQAQIPWVHQATWNDFGENHGIMPSANGSTTFAELNRFLCCRWQGRTSEVASPRFFLGRMREVQVGEDAIFELLALLPPGRQKTRFSLELLDGEGNPVHRFASRPVTADGLAAPHFLFPVSGLPAGHVIVPRATLRVDGWETMVIDGEPTIVSPPGFRPERCYSWVYTPEHLQPTDLRCELTVDGVPAGWALPAADAIGHVSIAVTSKVPVADVEILCRGRPVLVWRRLHPTLFPGTEIRGDAVLSTNRRGDLDWGFYQVRATTIDRRVAVSRPVFVAPGEGAGGSLVGFWPFDNGNDYRVLDESPWMRDGRLGGRTHYPQHQPTRVPDGRGGRCLSFDGIDDRLQMDGPVVPPEQFTVECRLKPASLGWPGQDGVALIFGAANADCVVSLGPDGVLTLSRKAAQGWVRVAARTPIAVDEWVHVAATYDGIGLELFCNGVTQGKVRATGRRPISRFAVGFNTVTGGSFFHGCIDDLRIHERVLTPGEFGPQSPLAK